MLLRNVLPILVGIIILVASVYILKNDKDDEADVFSKVTGGCAVYGIFLTGILLILLGLEIVGN